MSKSRYLIVAAALFALPAVAVAQDENREGDDNTVGEGTPSENLPAPRSDNDPTPPVAAPNVPEAGVVRQAGIGGPTAYGRAGVVELGGSASFTTAEDLSTLSLNPTIGWFFQDNLELSGILGINFNKVSGVSSTFVTALVEPSYHLPFNDRTFGFLGVGLGMAYESDEGAGFAVAPRLGANFLIGRSGVLTPAAFFNYYTVDVAGGDAGPTTLSVNAAYGLQIGYTIML